MHIKILACLASVVLIGCAGGGGASEVTNPPNNGGGSGPAVASELVGPITNSNGLRDDVNEYVEKTYAGNPAKKEAAVILAKAKQRALEIIAEGAPVTQAVVEKMSLAADCFAKHSDVKNFAREYRELAARTYNTETRMRANVEFSKKMDGMSLAVPEGVEPCGAAE